MHASNVPGGSDARSASPETVGKKEYVQVKEELASERERAERTGLSISGVE
jgi:hypothetical protein